jgi:hypothetical protein
VGLTVKGLSKLTVPGRYGDGHGLYLQVLSPTNRSWLLRYQRNSRERWLGLGPLHTVGLSQARERARQARLLLLDGIDPLNARAAEKAHHALAAAKALTFEQAAVAYFNQHERKWTNAKHRNQFLSSLRDYAFPVIGNLSIADIDTGLVLKSWSRFGSIRPRPPTACAAASPGLFCRSHKGGSAQGADIAALL